MQAEQHTEGAETSSPTDQRRRAFRSFGALPARELEQKPEIKRKEKRRTERRLAQHLEATRRRKEIEALRLFPELEGASPDEYTIDVDSSTCTSKKQRMVGVHAMAAACGGGIVAGGLFLAVGNDSGEASHQNSGGPLGPILLLVFGALILVDSARRLLRDHYMGRCPWQEVVTRRGAYEHFSEVPQGGKELADLIESEHAKAWNINRMARKLPRVADIIDDVDKKKKERNGKANSVRRSVGGKKGAGEEKSSNLQETRPTHKKLNYVQSRRPERQLEEDTSSGLVLKTAWGEGDSPYESSGSSSDGIAHSTSDEKQAGDTSSSSESGRDEYLGTKGGRSPLRPKGLPSFREGLSFADFKKKRMNHKT
eukprot:g3483.t1